MPKKILIVDDDKSVGHSLAMLLREEGYLVDNTTDSGEGARLIEKDGYDVCLFDYKAYLLLQDKQYYLVNLIVVP